MLTEQQISWIVLAATLVATVVFVIIYSRHMKKQEFSWARFAARVGIFGALSAVLYVVPIFQLQLPFFPSFLKIHFDEIPAFIAGFAYGPFTSLIVILVKTIIKLPFSDSLCVGELADFLFSSAFVLPATFVYKKIRNLKGVFIGLAISTVLQLVVAMVMNVYAILPFYIQVMGMSPEMILELCQMANPNITNIQWDYALFAILPMNLLKDAAVLIVTFFIYRRVHNTLHWETKQLSEPDNKNGNI